MELDPRLEALLDKEAIREVIQRYSRAIDRRDESRLLSMYHPEGTDDHGTFNGLGAVFATYAMSRLDSEFDCTYHFLSGSTVELSGNSAAAETYMLGIHVLKAHEGEPQRLDLLGARLVDCLEKRDGSWAILRRTVVRDWRHRTELLPPSGADEYKLGQPNASDPVYAEVARPGAAVT